jgi:hypothetical protein
MITPPGRLATPELLVDISRRILSTPEGRDFAARQIEDLANAHPVP